MERSARPALTVLVVLTVLSAGAFAMSAAGCGGSPGASLDGASWRLNGWTLNSLDPAAFTITASFAGGRISGTSAVNTYGGSYKAGPGDAFRVDQLASTEMAGPEPAMRAETAYITLLAAARTYRVSGGRLTLYDAGGNASLIFAAATP